MKVKALEERVAKLETAAKAESVEVAFTPEEERKLAEVRGPLAALLRRFEAGLVEDLSEQEAAHLEAYLVTVGDAERRARAGGTG